MSLSDLIATVVDNPTGFGPSTEHLPAQFKDIPYAPFSKNDKLGRIVDWNQGDPAQLAAGTSTRRQGQQGGKYQREPKEAYGAASAGTFAYFHDEDEASFSLVDGKTTGAKRGAGQGAGGGGGGGILGRVNQANKPGQRPQQGGRFGQQGGRPGQNNARSGPGGRQDSRFGGRGGRQGQNGRLGYRDWNKEQRTRDASVVVGPEWQQLEEIEFPRLSKLRLEVDTTEPETISQHGFLYEYDRTYDRVTTKNEKPLQIIDRIRYNPTTSDDPVIQEIAARDRAQIYATDSVLAMLMCANRTVYPWDIVFTREGDKLFMDKREGGPFDFPSVNENASDPPAENERDSLNTPSNLSLEATYINQNFAFQVVKEDTNSRVDLEHPNPFYSPDETEPLASCAYRYRKFDLSVSEDEDISIVVRTEVDSFVKGLGNSSDEMSYITIKTLNEFDSRAQGSGGAPDWRTKLDSQRGAVVATEMKNNSSKLARWAVQSILAGAEQMKMGYVSRATARDSSRHTILGTQWYKPREFAAQINVNLSNGWGIVRTISDLVLAQPEGKYILVKDPNKPVMRLYRIPANAFEADDDDLLDEEVVGDAGSDGGM
ncbi:hypothetical protein OIO90_005325 [Microbotryomycetes sp. JL221]|nr:hypothetical protein OIO90_005325 [Microbotryomycetes sp. JL221]